MRQEPCNCTSGRECDGGKVTHISSSNQRKMALNSLWNLICGDSKNGNGLSPICPAFIISAQILRAFKIDPAGREWLCLCQ